MRRSLLVIPILIFVALGGSDHPARSGTPSADVVARANSIADAVLSHQIDPPTRQQMILDGLRSVHEEAGVPPPSGMARRVSALASPDQLATLLAEVWPRSDRKDLRSTELEDAFLRGMLVSIPGAGIISDKELKVAEQIEGNLYVGVHIGVDYDVEEKRPIIAVAMEGGPAHRAGARGGDRIEEIDGVSTQGMSLEQAIDRLRGADGTEVAVRLQDKASGAVRALTMKRGRMPKATVTGARQRPDGSWIARLDGPAAIGYLRVADIAGSTPQELRQMAPRLEAEGIRALILDLRSVSSSGFHPTVLLADSLLDGGTIGRVRKADSVEVYEAEPDSLFRDWPLAVLVDGSTSGEAAWLCAALQDNHRAVVVGTSPGYGSEVLSPVTLPGGEWSIRITTGRLERGDGRPLSGPSRLRARAGQSLTFRGRPFPSVEGDLIPDVPVPQPGLGVMRYLPEGRISSVPKDPAIDPVVVKAGERLADILKSDRR
jgi:carboxyl-terminal processing protease